MVIAFGFHPFDVFHKILCIRPIKLGFQTAALRFVIRFHPWRSGPGRAKYLDMGVDSENFFKDGDHVLPIRAKAKLGQLYICSALRQIIVGIYAGIHVRGCDGHSQVADADTLPGGREEFFQECGPLSGLHTHEKLRTSAGQGETETVDSLILLAIVHFDRGSRIAGSRKV